MRTACCISRQSVAQTICGLRRKLGDTGRDPRVLVHRYGFGYMLVCDAVQVVAATCMAKHKAALPGSDLRLFPPNRRHLTLLMLPQ